MPRRAQVPGSQGLGMVRLGGGRGTGGKSHRRGGRAQLRGSWFAQFKCIPNVESIHIFVFDFEICRLYFPNKKKFEKKCTQKNIGLAHSDFANHLTVSDSRASAV